MKYFLMATFSLIFLSGNEASALGPAGGLLKSVGVVSPEGDVILYYREGDAVVIKNCAPLTVLGKTAKEAKASCQGKSNKVSVGALKRELRKSISTQPLNHLKPLTKEEVEAYKKNGISSDKIQAMRQEVERLNKFFEAYKVKNDPLVVRLDELMKTLEKNDAHAALIKKIDDEIEKAIDLIVDEKALKIVDAKTDDCNGTTERPFLYTVLKSLESKLPCGQKGTVDERIKYCSKAEGAKKGNYALVSRTAKGQEVWKDTKSGLVWSDRLASSMSHYDAEYACKNGLEEMAGISSDWKLPTRAQYETASANGIRGALPKMSYSFWSSSVPRSGAGVAWLFGGFNGYVDYFNRSFSYSVRCVAR